MCEWQEIRFQTHRTKKLAAFFITQNKYDTCNIQHKITHKHTKYPRFHKHVQLDIKIAWSPLDLKWGEYGTKYVVHHGAPKTSSKKLLATLTATCTYKYGQNWIRNCMIAVRAKMRCIWYYIQRYIVAPKNIIKKAVRYIYSHVYVCVRTCTYMYVQVHPSENQCH